MFRIKRKKKNFFLFEKWENENATGNAYIAKATSI